MDINTVISQILHACRLAREMEANLPNLAAHPPALRGSCQDIVNAFNSAIHGLDTHEQGPPAMDLFGLSSMDEGPPEDEMGILPLMETFGFGVGSSGNASFNANSQDVDSQETQFLEDVGEPTLPTLAGSSSSSAGLTGRRSNSGSTGQRQSRKRKEGKGMRSVRVPAVRAGNMENPPDDGYTWRKYGQKDILGSRFPRSYFRCTHKNFYGCPAKKQVQRLDEDPYAYEVTYCFDHTCQTSTTPLILPPLVAGGGNPQTEIAMAGVAAEAPSSSSLSTSIQLGSHWFDLGHVDFHPRGGESSGAAHAGTSECPVADLADVMFNSGSSGSSLDAMFSLRHESWKDKEAE